MSLRADLEARLSASEKEHTKVLALVQKYRKQEANALQLKNDAKAYAGRLANEIAAMRQTLSRLPKDQSEEEESE